MNVLLHGGGLDSTAVLLDLVNRKIIFDVLHINYGQKACESERRAVKKQCKTYNLNFRAWTNSSISSRCVNPGRDNSQLFTGNLDHDPIVEARNMFFIMDAIILGYSNIYVGIDKPATGKPWPDASHEFVTCTNALLKMSFLQVPKQVIAPFLNTDKITVFEQALARDPQFFSMSATCWTPQPVTNDPCGQCKHCKLETLYKEQLNVSKCTPRILQELLLEANRKRLNDN